MDTKHGFFSLDLVKAFDRVPRDMLWSVLSKFGAPKPIAMLKAPHAKIFVKFEVDKVSQTIACIVGIKQGDGTCAIRYLYGGCHEFMETEAQWQTQAVRLSAEA